LFFAHDLYLIQITKYNLPKKNASVVMKIIIQLLTSPSSTAINAQESEATITSLKNKSSAQKDFITNNSTTIVAHEHVCICRTSDTRSTAQLSKRTKQDTPRPTRSHNLLI